MEHFELDRTDEEREELVKQWIKDYWLMLVIVVLGAIGAVYALNYFRQAKLDNLNKMAAKTEQVGLALRDNKVDNAKKIVTGLQENNKDTSFSTVATLSLAQKYFSEKKYNEAISQYDWLISQEKDIAMRNLARLRKARVHADAKQIKEAVDTLNSVEGNANLYESYLLKADILLSDKQFDEAEKTYKSILTDKSANNELINQRLELLGIMKQKNTESGDSNEKK